ncbi:hypothetical protein CLOSTMETH_03516 [[Clostridium] methylpentosum DSM 5476]|uniref:Transposase IS200-like domain-containing protein n=1 Tax=[Clostridium] methylpentosum DSM 5476 TaxID=537013 RepID=C0EI21_9FIRM|nr:hypothetical protein CLOSTMETH_03516 [[Clostridium] methylpentosum DSM 5476]
MVQKKAFADDAEKRTPFVVEWACGQATVRKNKRRTLKMNDRKSITQSLPLRVYELDKYHIVFAPKYRRKVFYGEKRREIGKILRTLSNWKKMRIVEAEVCSDQVHMLAENLPKVAVSRFIE